MSDSKLSKPGKNKDFQKKLIAVIAVFIFSFTVLLFVTSFIQLFRNPEFTNRTKINREKIVRIPPIRGKIFSSDGNILADNKTIFNVYINPKELSSNFQDRQKSLFYLANVLNYNYSDIEKILSSKIKQKGDILISENISFYNYIKIKENIEKLQGIVIKEDSIRYYPYKNTISHALGYIGPIDSNEYAVKKQLGYIQLDIIGKNGIEKEYENELRGKEGKKVFIVDARMVVQEEDYSKEISAQSGSEIVLTVDLFLQKAVEETLADRTGTILVMKPYNGEILAMTSYPNFDPNIYVLENEENYEKKRMIELDTKDTPLINRNIQTLYPSASIFKIVTATAILNENLISPYKQFYCGGFYQLNNQIFGCWVRPGAHGFQNLEDALVNSCDVYFYNAALIVGIDRISKYATDYGFGQPLGVDIPYEKSGLIPSVKWKKEQNQNWHHGDTLNTVIGQGDVKITPLQLANLLSVVCNKGKSYKPRFVKEIRSSTDGSTIKKYDRELLTDMKINQTVFYEIEKYLRTVITVGTGKWSFWGNDLKFVGKTGTAEVGMSNKKSTHSLFAGYGPIDYPPEERIVVVTLVENDNNEYLKYSARLSNLVFNSWYKKESFKESAKRFGFPIQDSYK